MRPTPTSEVCGHCDAPARYYVNPDQAVGKLADGQYLLPSPYACRRHLSQLVELATLYLLGHEDYRDNRITVDIKVTVIPAFLIT